MEDTISFQNTTLKATLDFKIVFEKFSQKDKKGNGRTHQQMPVMIMYYIGTLPYTRGVFHDSYKLSGQ